MQRIALIIFALAASLLSLTYSAIAADAIDYLRESLSSGNAQPVDSLYSSLATDYLHCSQSFRIAALTRDDAYLSKAMNCQKAAINEGNASIVKYTRTLHAAASHEALQVFTSYWRVQIFEMRLRKYSEEHDLDVIRHLKQYIEMIRAQSD